MKYAILVPFAILALAANSCKKPESNTITNTGGYGTYSSLDTIFTILKPASKFVTINATTGGSFYGLSGSRFIFPAGVFQDAMGNIVTGQVQIEVREFLKKGDMIFGKALPVSLNEPLSSGGEVYTNAMQGGMPVYIRPGYTFQVNLPQGKVPDAGMTLFRGQFVESTTNNVVWNNAIDSFASGVVYNGDTISIYPDSCGWANADRFLSNPNYQSFKVTLSIAGHNVNAPASTVTYAMYDQYKGVWPMGTPSNNEISEGHVPDVPVHFVSFTVINNKFYGGVTAATPVNGGNYTILLSEVDPVGFKGQINNLTN